MAKVIYICGKDAHPALPARMLVDPDLKHHTVNDMVIDRRLAFEVWKATGFQRAIRNTRKVKELAAALLREPVIRYGALLIGCLDGKLYRVDGNHRLRAFDISGLPSIRATVQFARFESEQEMAEAYRQVQRDL